MNEKGEIRTKEEKSRLPVDVRGSKMSVLKFPNNNLLLTEGEGRTGEYWPEVVIVRTEHREVRTKMTEGQYSPVRLEQDRLVSSLLYGARLMLYAYFFQTHFRSVKFKRLPAGDDARNSERTSYHDFKKKKLNIFRTFNLPA